MPSKPDENLNPRVEVRVPKINLRLEDLTYLRGLANPNGVYCRISDNKIDRLKVLGLVEEKRFPLPEKEQKEAQTEYENLEREMLALVEARNWSRVHDKSYNMYRAKQRLTETTIKTVLTATGALLLQKGEVRVRIKKGCA